MASIAARLITILNSLGISVKPPRTPRGLAAAGLRCPASPPSLHLAPADVAAAEAARKVDRVDRPIGPLPRFSDRRAARCDVQDPASAGDQPAIGERGAGMEDLRLPDLADAYLTSAFRRPRIA